MRRLTVRHSSKLVIRLTGLMVFLLGPSVIRAEGSFGPEEMLQIVDFGSPIEFAPTGDWAAYVLPDMNDEWNVLARRPHGYVHVRRIQAGADSQSRALTKGAERSSFPVWSPSGKYLAFVSDGPEGVYIKTWEAASGEIRKLEPALPAAPYLAPQWALNETVIVVAPEIVPPAPSEPPRVEVFHTTDPVLPGDAFFSDRRQARIWAVSTQGEPHHELYSSPLALRSWSVSPDQRGLIYQIATDLNSRRSSRRSFLLDLAGAVPPLPLGSSGGAPSWLPDGHLLVHRKDGYEIFVPDGSQPLISQEVPFRISNPLWHPGSERFLTLVEDPSQQDPEIEPVKPGMYTIARPFWDLYLVSRSGEYKNITEGLPDQISDPVWSPKGDAFYFRSTNNQNYDESLWRYDLQSQQLQRLLGGAYSFGDLAALANGLAFTRQSATAPEDLWWLPTGSSEPVRLTHLNPQLDDIQFSTPELFYFESQRGDRLGALLYKPAGFQPGQKVPVITYVYEKLTPGKNRFSPRHQLFLQNGYAVLMPNVKVKVGQTGDSFVWSVVPAVEAVKNMGITNGKFALWGGSFGAYATSFVITQTNIFACAVSRATPPELFRNWASGRDRDSDNIETGQARMGGSPFEFKDRYLSQSAFFHLDQVETPVLLMHGRKDHTILFEEGAMMFYALRRLGKEADFVAYREGDHSLYRHSRADGLDVHYRMLDWFRKYLRPESKKQ